MNKYLIPRYKLDLSPIQSIINFVDLYKIEVVDRLNQNVEHWHEFQSVITKDIIDALIENYNAIIGDDDDDEDLDARRHTVAAEFFVMLKTSSNNLFFHSAVMDFLKKHDNELFKCMCVDVWEHLESFETFQKLLLIMHEFRRFVDIDKVYTRLRKYSSKLDEIYDPVIQRLKKDDIDHEYACSLLIRTFCMMVDDATYHLLYAVYLSSKEAEDYIEKHFPNFKLFYQKNIFDDRCGIIHVVEAKDDVMSAMESIMSGAKLSPYAKHIFFEEIPPHHLMPLLYHTTADYPLNLRNYQQELSERAIKGENTLICAPTGSGKTIVAINIIRDHIYNNQKEGKSSKVIFVVPSVPLVEQQKAQIIKYLGHFASVDKVYGGMEIDSLAFDALVASVDILVLTPQILVNHITDKYCKLENRKPVSFDAFTLIVLDEVHHTAKDHPYAMLMEEYHRQKYGDSVIPLKIMPQVVGLTASIGCPAKPKKASEIVDYMVSICANFDARSITRVAKNVEELAEFTCKTDDDVRVIKNNDETTRKYYEYIHTLSNAIEEYFKAMDGILDIPRILRDYCSIEAPDYLKWLANANQATAESHLPVQSQMDAYSCLEYLRTLYDALMCAKCLPTKDVSEFYFEDLGNPSGTRLERYVYQKKQELGEFPSSESDLYQRLIERIKEQFKALPDSRIIIFLPQRSYCQIAARIIERDSGIKGEYITSANASRDEGGINPALQQETLKKFREGAINILFATSVADEGLDIQKCNLVIKYQYVTDNIAHVQRKGRARDLQSQSVLFTCEDRLNNQESNIISTVEMIQEAYDILDGFTESFKDQIFANAIELYNCKRIKDEKEEEILRSRMGPKCIEYTVCCRKCGTPTVECVNLRMCYRNCVVYGPKFWSTVNFFEEPINQPLCRKKAGIVGNIACMKCGFKLGTVLNVKSTSLPAFAIECVVFFEKALSKKIQKKKWSQVYNGLFYPIDITYEELLEMRMTELQPTLKNRKQKELAFDVADLDGALNDLD